jgi:hypothetical protein
MFTFTVTMSHGSAVCIGTDYGLDEREIRVRVPGESRILTFLYRPDRVPGGKVKR